MKDFLLVIGSVVVCVVADLVIDYYFLKTHKIGSEDYKNSLKFAQKNKGIVNKQDFIESMFNKISELEGQLNYLVKQSSVGIPDVSELKRDLSALKNEVRKDLRKESDYEDNIQNILNELSKLSRRIAFLEKQNEGRGAVASSDNANLERKIRQLEDELKRMNTIINEQRELLEGNDRVVHNLNKEIIELKSYVSSQSKIIESFNKEQTSAQQREIVLNAPQQQNKSKPKSFASTRTLVPNESYVRRLLTNLSNIEGHLGDYEFARCKKGFQNILNDGDFDDGEEIMDSVHSLINNYIYGSDSKVSQSDWVKLEKYLEDAGYEAVNVKSGDDIAPYRTLFDRPIPASGGTPNTIKQVQLCPYILTYEDCGVKETLKLCGKCTYYK